MTGAAQPPARQPEEVDVPRSGRTWIRCFSTLALAAGCAWPAAAQLAPRVPHGKQRAQLFTTHQKAARLVVKFHQGTGVRHGAGGLYVAPGHPQITNPYVPQLTRTQVEKDLRAVDALARRLETRATPLVRDGVSRLAAWRARGQAYWGRELADLSLYFQVPLRHWGVGQSARALVDELNRLPAVEIAYGEPLAYPLLVDELAAPTPNPWSCGPGDVTDPAPDFEADQGYLSAAPIGTDAFAAWTYAGGRGDGVRVIDVEGGYRDHSDHPTLLSLVGHYTHNYVEHGQKVIGVLAAGDDGAGTTGVASDASVGFRSIFNFNLHDDWPEANTDSFNVSHNLYWASQHSLEGIVLIELQRPGPEDEDCPCSNSGCVATPVEFWPAEFDTIETATGNGVVVVEAAGNGAHNLDSAVFEGLFDRAVRDSGAVLTSGSHALTRAPMCFTGAANSGSRVDVHSWGENIVTTGAGALANVIHSDGWCNSYVDDFNGTSGASAIVAGVAASLQGAALANLGSKLDPLTLRQLLVDTGTPQAAGPNGELIGPQPNLAAALAELLP
jgi:hypothetical protein